MKKIALTLLALCAIVVGTWAQTARVQVIHNSPNPTVDIYAGTALFLDDVAFRTASDFKTVPAGIAIPISVAPSNSTSVADAIYTQTITFDAGKTYYVSATGVVFNAVTPFQLLVYEGARETATAPNKVDVIVQHGAPDAPSVDVGVRVQNYHVSNLAYGQTSGYKSYAPGSAYYFDVRPAGDSNTIVATYKADLSALAGQSLFVFASGFLTPGAGDPFGLYAALANGTVIALPAATVARVQVVHNSPSGTVDVWANGSKLIEDFEFRTATPFIYLASGVDINIGVAPASSTSQSESIYTYTTRLKNGGQYVLAATGLVGDAATPFKILRDSNAFEISKVPNMTGVSVWHGSPGAPNVDILENGTNAGLYGNLAYETYTIYKKFAPNQYYIDVNVAGTSTKVETYSLDLTALKDSTLRVFASGIVGGNPEFGLYAVRSNGTVYALPAGPPPATAKVQVIHNSPDPTVDVYVNGSLALDNFAFRTATPYLNFDANVPLTIAVAPSTSTSVAEAIFSSNVTLDPTKTYTLAASGIVFNPTTPFTFAVNPAARAAATNPAKVDFNALHGATDAPAVDIVLHGTNTILFGNLAYGTYSTDYQSVDPGVYFIDVKPAGSSTIVATYKADLTGLQGQSLTVFASGLLTAGASPAFGLYAALSNGTVIALPKETPPAPVFARIQVIHNSPSPTVDVYINGVLQIDNFAFRNATPFLTVPAGVVLNIGIAPGNSQSAGDVLATFPATLAADGTYIIVASGILGNVATPFTLNVNPTGQESAAIAGKVDVAILHGAPNAPAVDVDEVFNGNVVSNLAYGSYTPYLSLDPTIYDFSISAAGSPNPIVTYRADLTTLAGGAAYVFASGLIGVSGNEAFGLYAALPNGTVIAFPLTPTSKVQIIHNSPSPTVDIYVGKTLLLDNFVYRTATPYVDVPAGRTFSIGVAPATSTSSADAIASFPVSLDATKAYTVFAAGLVGGTPGFNLFIADNALAVSPVGTTSVSVFHGASDAPAVDVVERLAGTLVSDLTFGEYSGYLQLPSNTYVIDVKPAGASQIVQSFLVDLAGLNGQAIRVFASGLLNGQPGFGLFAVLSDGTVVELPVTRLARVQIIHNSPSPTVDVYAGTTPLLDDFEFQTATGFGYLPADVQIPIGVAPASSTSSADAIATFNVTFENGKTYVVVASGIVGNATTPFTLLVNDAGQERSTNPAELQVSVLHGSPGAPSVNVVPFGSDTPLLSDLAYTNFTDYVAIPATTLFLDIVPSSSPNTFVGTWGADFSGTEGIAGVVMASGLLSGNPDFGLILVLPNGFVIPLPAFSRVQVIHNSPSPDVDVYLDDDILLDNFVFREATGVGLLLSDVPFDLKVAPATSQSSADQIYTLNVPSLQTGKTYVIVAAGVVGNATTPFKLYVNANGRDRSENGLNADVSLFHGAPDAPEIDIVTLGLPVFDNVEFGEFTPYLSVPPAQYILGVTPSNDNNNVLVSYVANLVPVGGLGITVFASGYLTPPTAQDPAFQAWVALPDGTTFPLPVFTSTNELDQNIGGLSLSPNPTSDQTTIRFELKQAETMRYLIRDVAGRAITEGTFGEVAAGVFTETLEVSNLDSGMYFLELRSDAGMRTVRFIVQR